jgi:anti-anti-sigma regulatory factor
MVMPLIGAMDAERAQQVMESALEGASRRRAEFVILDVTGVKGLDARWRTCWCERARGSACWERA